MKTIKRFFLALVVLAIAIGALGLWILYGSKTTNPYNYETIGDIPTPWGYERMAPDDGGYAAYLRSLPLKGKGSKVQLYTGGDARFQSLAYAVVDLPLLSNDEQCADVCMRLRAEYLYSKGQYGSIHFRNVNGNTMRYGGGGSRKAFERYMRMVYSSASTFSLKHELPNRALRDMQPGDVFVYAAGDHDLERKMHSKYGHAIMVVDVAVDRHGNKAFLLAEGNTPARDIHILRNWANLLSSPWFLLDADADNFFLDCFYYRSNELRHF